MNKFKQLSDAYFMTQFDREKQEIFLGNSINTIDIPQNLELA